MRPCARRGYITADARNQTEYGTVRSYIAVGLEHQRRRASTTRANTFSANRAFIQLAGFTFGLRSRSSTSTAVPATSYFGCVPGSPTPAIGAGWSAAYTAQFGNGLSASLSAEDASHDADRQPSIGGRGGTASATSVLPAATRPLARPFGAGAYGGCQSPDVVANLRVDQAWGSAQIMGALHDVNADYYGAARSTPVTAIRATSWASPSVPASSS